ncbi:MAG: Ldh family oxidoreductase [Candidatus Bathyarchaeota archaeon]|nr:Ldh family oxidoreductase [Candidatus Bathyarchaeota archaeon]
MPVFRAEQLTKVGTEVFVAAGAPPEEAKLVSELLVKSNLAGHDSHGVIRIIQYVEAIEQEKLKPGAEIEVVHETDSSALLNGNWGFGQVVAKKAMEKAIEKAKVSSIGTVCAFDLYHVGRLADYTAMAAENDVVGIAMANSRNVVAPFGGSERMLSTGPISYAFPTGKGSLFILDIATSVCAEGKVRVSFHKGAKLPDGCIIDKHGNPSNEPADLYDGGAILPLGGDSVGHKGFGLSLVVEVLSGILSGAGCAYEPGKRGNGLFFEVIDVESFMPVDKFKRRIDDLVHAVKSSKLRPGFGEILIPGEPEYRTEKKRLKEGIYVPEKTWEEIKKTAKKLDLDLETFVSGK